MPSAANGARQPSVSTAASSENDDLPSTDRNSPPSKEDGASSQVLNASHPEGDEPSSSDSIAPRPENETEPHPLLQSRDHNELLDTIDNLRSKGLGSHVSLPQLVVCGDQSVGKSSVLEAVSGVRFPTNDTTCTRFPTELVLRRSPKEDVKVSITPGKSRSAAEKQPLYSYMFTNPTIENIPQIIEDAKRVMGIGQKNKSFSDDILRFEISGPRQPHLTLIDCPGVIHSETKDHSNTDIETVQQLVKDYMENPRSIILAVISAKTDLPNQIVTKLAREKDPDGRRTLGIITKPDFLDAGSDSETSFFELAQNKNVYLDLGWHVLKNRDWKNRNCSSEERDASEKAFFSQGIWMNLPSDRLGISSLKPRLSDRLKLQIISELPHLKSDVQKGIQDCLQTLDKLGPERFTLEQQREHLMRITGKFRSIMRQALDGNYEEEFFEATSSSDEHSKRLRAVIQDQLSEFEKEMRSKGHAVEIIDSEYTDNQDHQKRVARDDFVEGEALDLLRLSRGRELPGLVNPLFVGNLFHMQSKPWGKLAEKRRNEILNAVRLFLDTLLVHLTDDATRQGLERHVIRPAMEEYAKDLDTKIAEILKPHQRGHLITHNEQFAKNVHAIREKHAGERTLEILTDYFNCSSDAKEIKDPYVDVQQLLHELTSSTEEDMEYYACSEATDCMLAYYKAALHLFVDNFAHLVIETTMVEKLDDILTPQLVSRLPDKTVEDIAAEPQVSQDERDRVNVKLDSLKKGLSILQNVEHHNIPTRATGNRSSQTETEGGQPGGTARPTTSRQSVSVNVEPPAAAFASTSVFSDQPSGSFGSGQIRSTTFAPAANGYQNGVSDFRRSPFNSSQRIEPGLFATPAPTATTQRATLNAGAPIRSDSKSPRRKSWNNSSASPNQQTQRVGGNSYSNHDETEEL